MKRRMYEMFNKGCNLWHRLLSFLSDCWQFICILFFIFSLVIMTGCSIAEPDSGVTYVDLSSLSGGGGDSHITILPLNYDSIAQGTWTYFSAPGAWSSRHFLNSTTNDGDSIIYKIYLASGTYSLMLFHDTTSSSGIVDFYIDTDEVASFDCYSAGTSYEVRDIQENIVISEGGLKDLKLIIDGKNGSSSNYALYWHTISIWRTE